MARLALAGARLRRQRADVHALHQRGHALATDFAFTAGQPSTYRSSAKGQRTHCPICGAQLTFKLDALDEIDVTVCSLDDPEAVAPHDHTYTSTQLSWVNLDDGLPRYAKAR